MKWNGKRKSFYEHLAFFRFASYFPPFCCRFQSFLSPSPPLSFLSISSFWYAQNVNNVARFFFSIFPSIIIIFIVVSQKFNYWVLGNPIIHTHNEHLGKFPSREKDLIGKIIVSLVIIAYQSSLLKKFTLNNTICTFTLKCKEIEWYLCGCRRNLHTHIHTDFSVNVNIYFDTHNNNNNNKWSQAKISIPKKYQMEIEIQPFIYASFPIFTLWLSYMFIMSKVFSNLMAK